MPATAIVFTSQEGELVSMPVALAQRSQYLEKLLEQHGAASDGSIPVELLIESDTRPPKHAIEKMIRYLSYFSENKCRPSVIPKPLPTTLYHYLTDWEKDFLTKELLVNGDPSRHTDLLILQNMATKLEIECLRDLCTAWIATQLEELIRDKNMMDGAAAIREFFGLPNEWTDEEMGHLQREMEYYESIDKRKS